MAYTQYTQNVRVPEGGPIRQAKDKLVAFNHCVAHHFTTGEVTTTVITLTALLARQTDSRTGQPVKPLATRTGVYITISSGFDQFGIALGAIQTSDAGGVLRKYAYSVRNPISSGATCFIMASASQELWIRIDAGASQIEITEVG